jgi:hypothetical protein
MITIQQGTAINRLVILGFIFAPPTLVAVSFSCRARDQVADFMEQTIFGMTELHASPKIFPIAALPVLLVVGLVLSITIKCRGLEFRPNNQAVGPVFALEPLLEAEAEVARPLARKHKETLSLFRELEDPENVSSSEPLLARARAY